MMYQTERCYLWFEAKSPSISLEVSLRGRGLERVQGSLQWQMRLAVDEAQDKTLAVDMSCCPGIAMIVEA